MEKREQARGRQRLTCEIRAGEARHAGIVRDLSPGGLFVQTRARLSPDERLAVRITLDDGEPLDVVARVARVRDVPGRLQGSVTGGVGLEVLEAPDAFRALAERLAGESEGPGPTAPPAARSFRVRLVRRGTPQARILTVHCESRHAARARAGARLGRDWKVTEVEEA